MDVVNVPADAASSLHLATIPASEAGKQAASQFAPGQAFSENCIQYRSRIIHDLIIKATRYASSSATVLITGESGTGKELFARLVHQNSHRAGGRFAQVNCAALSESLMESEMFGHERGAFTGAVERRVGRFEWADGGTLLLDEISEIPVSLQAKLLRVLEENEFQRVGSNQNQPTDVRIVATSNRDLAKRVKSQEFREDLYYRLNILWLDLPPLRQRREDIPVLANSFLSKFRHESVAQIQGFSKPALQKICDYDWPGNVRQLRNAVHAACVIATGNRVEADDLPTFELAKPQIPAWMTSLTLEEIERRMILEQLMRYHGNKSHVAAVLGVTTRTIANKLRTYQEQGLLALS